MKPLTFTTLLTILLFSLNVFANHDASVLKIQTFNRIPIIVEINGVEQNHTPVSVFEISNIAPGKHKIKVFVIERVGRKSFLNEIFSDRIVIAPASIVTGIIRYGTMTVSNKPIFTAPVCCTASICHHNSHNSYGHKQHNDYGYNEGYNNSHKYRYESYGFNDNRYRYQHNYDYRHYDFNNYNRGINRDDFNQLKRMMARQSFEDSKLKIAKQASRDNYLDSRQVRDLLELFTFESTKLDFAKYAYDSVIDKNKYYIIYDAFTFSSSIDEIENYLGNR